MLRMTVAGEADRPYFPYVLLAVHEKTGVVLCHELLAPLPSLTAMDGKIPETLLRCFEATQQVPAAVKVRAPDLYEQLEPLAKKLNLELRLCTKLPKLEMARRSLEQFMGNPRPR
jgi:hypothetical protein